MIFVIILLGFVLGVFLQNDIDSDDPEYLKLKWDKKGIMVVDGLDLNQTEKKKKWMFADFKDLEQLCSSIVEWSGYYFASFCVVRKKMIK